MLNWLHRDHLSSVRRITDAAGAITRSSVYKPYGTQVETVVAALSPAEPKGWIGERTDPETGLTYLHARYYDAALGRFLSPDWWDPSDPGVGTDRYGYSLGDPVNKADANGHCFWDVCTFEGVTVALLLGTATLYYANLSGQSLGYLAIDMQEKFKQRPPCACARPGEAVGAYLGGLFGAGVLQSESDDGKKPVVKPKKITDAVREAGYGSSDDFGDAVEWGSGEAGIDEAIATLDKDRIDRMKARGLTEEKLRGVRDAYDGVVQGSKDQPRKKGGEVAPKRTKYLDDILDKWDKEDW